MSRRFAYTTRPFFPIWSSNLRQPFKRKRKKVRGRGVSGPGGTFMRNKRGSRPNLKTWAGGGAPLFTRLPRWPEAAMRNKRKQYEPLNLSKLRMFIEKGRIDTSFPITQRHLFESRCVTKIKWGVGLFNVNDFPFPYQIDVEVCAADQGSIDMIRAVGGSVTIVYMGPVSLRAHVKPHKYQVLPRTARPRLKTIHYLEKMKARGALVRYIKPLWLIDEEKRLQTQLREIQSEDGKALVERLARENDRVGV